MVSRANLSKEEYLLVKQTLVIIPCYNMNNLIQKTVSDLKEFLKIFLLLLIIVMIR